MQTDIRNSALYGMAVSAIYSYFFCQTTTTMYGVTTVSNTCTDWTYAFSMTLTGSTLVGIWGALKSYKMNLHVPNSLDLKELKKKIADTYSYEIKKFPAKRSWQVEEEARRLFFTNLREVG